MRPPRPAWLALPLALAAACPNPASAPAPRPRPPAVAEDTPGTAPARRLARWLHAEARGRLARADRPALAAALRIRAAELAGIGAPTAAVADLDRAARLAPGPRDPALRALAGRLRLALADRALARGALGEARRGYDRLTAGDPAAPAPRAPWRRAALAPGDAPLAALGEAIRRLHRRGPGQAGRLLASYLARGGAEPPTLLAGLEAVREHPGQRLAPGAFRALARSGSSGALARACTLWGRAHRAPECARAPASACADAGCRARCLVAEGRLPEALAAAQGAEAAGARAALRRLGALFFLWGVAIPGSPDRWPVPVAPGGDLAGALAALRQGASEARRRPDPHRAILDLAFAGRAGEALAEARRAAAARPEALRLLARLQALAGRREAAGRTLRTLAERSPGGARHLPAVLHDLGVLGLRRIALGLATPLAEALPEDPVLLRALAGLWLRLGDGERARLVVERWAAVSGDPGAAYRFALRRAADAQDGLGTARWARHLLEWTGGVPGPSREAAARALRQVGRAAAADALGGGSAAGSGQPGPAGTTPGMLTAAREAAAAGRLEEALARIALLATGATPARRAALGRLAAVLSDGAGRPARARRILAASFGADPDRFSSAAYRLLAAAIRGRRLSPFLPWAMLAADRSPGCPTP